MQRAPEVAFIAITGADGSLAVMQFVLAEYDTDGSPRWKRAATREAVEAEIARSAWDAGFLPVKGWRFLAGPDALPRDRTYRAAWADDGKAIVHDMAKARDAHRNRLRHMRRAALAKADADWMKAFATGGDANAVEAGRQRLRDLPQDPRIDAAATVEDLMAIWPEDLPR